MELPWIGRLFGRRDQKRCVYTCLLGGYEQLLEQPVRKEDDIPFICFTDDPTLTSESWEIRLIDPVLPLDLARSSRHPKICAHEYVSEFDESIYIDNSIKLIKPPTYIFEQFLDNQPHDMACFGHSFRDTIAGEFEAIEEAGYDFPETLRAMHSDYSSLDYDFSAKPMWGGFLIRRHNVDHVKKCMNVWYSNVLRYSRRDQLSFDYAMKRTGLKLTVNYVDIRSTDFHQWPCAPRLGSARVVPEIEAV